MRAALKFMAKPKSSKAKVVELTWEAGKKPAESHT